MRKKLGRILAGAAVSSTLVCSAVGLFAVPAITAKSATFLFDGELNETYNVNDTVTIPPAMIAGEDAEYRIVFPDGTFSDASSLKLTKAGQYKVEYTAVVGGKVYKETKTFLVGNSMFTLSGLGTAEYRVMEDTGIGGMYFNMYNGDEITFNGIVDLTTLEDTLIKLIPIASVVGERDISRFQITLTDAYDESKTVTVRMKGDNAITYMDATFNDGKYCGFNKQFGTGEYFVDGITGMSYTEMTTAAFIDSNNYGTSITNGFSGGTAANPKNGGKQWLGFSYDEATNLVYARSSSNERYVVTDLENGNIYSEAFDGFTDGKVKVTIKPTIFQKGSCGLFITEIGGQKIAEGNSSAYVPEYTPEIAVDYGEYVNDTVPKVKQGDTYQLFKATAYDPVEGSLPVKTTVYYGYNNAQKVQVNVTDNAFVAKRAGLYTVVYEATNSNGKTGREIVEIISVNDDSVLELALTGEPDYTRAVSAGTAVKVLTDYAFVNNYGIGKLTVTATLKSDSAIAFELNEKNDYTFTPVVSGEYTIAYAFSDYSARETIEKTLTVTASEHVYYEAETFPKYLIQNGNYDLSLVKAYTLDTGVPVEQNVSLYVEKDGALEAVEQLFEVKSEYVTDDKICLVYKPDVASVQEEDYKRVQIPVVSAGLYEDKLDTTKYFVAEKGSLTFSKQSGKIACAVDAFDNGSATFAFANKLNCNPFILELSALVAEEETFNAFERVNVYLYDATNLERYVKASLYAKNNAWYISINDTKEIEIAKTWGGKDDAWSIRYNSVGTKAVINNLYTYTDVAFFGTETPAVYEKGCNLVVEIVGQDGCDGILVSNINGVNRWGSTRDNSPADVDVASDNNAGEKDLNEVVTLQPFYVYDVFAPYVQSSLTVTYQPFGSSERTVVTTLDGVKMEDLPTDASYAFKLTQHGTYNVTITKSDPDNESNNGEPYSYSITVTDYVKPVVTMDTRTRATNVGAKLNLPDYTVDKEDCKVYVTVKAPDATFMSYVDISKSTTDTADDTYTFQVKGEYIITLVVYDSNYNFTEVSYKVIVE